VPFASAYKLASHFVAHGHEFGAANEIEYERMADMFMSQPMQPDLYECIRLTGMGDRIRLDGAIGYYGVAYGTLTIRTFHTKTQYQIAHAGGPQGYVNRKCAEIR